MASQSISVVIPVYNAERYVADAIESVLDQSLSVQEIIAVDDGSTDASASAIRAFDDVRYVHQTNSGAAAARNQGVQLAMGDLLAFLDADDVWASDKLTKQVTALQSDPNLDAVFGHAQQVVLGSPDQEQRTPPMSGQVLPAFLPSAMLIRRESFDQVGTFSTHHRVGDVVDWYSRAVDVGLSTTMLPDVVYYRRIHGDNLGVKERDNPSHYLNVVREMLKRRRGDSP